LRDSRLIPALSPFFALVGYPRQPGVVRTERLEKRGRRDGTKTWIDRPAVDDPRYDLEDDVVWSGLDRTPQIVAYDRDEAFRGREAAETYP